MTPVPSAVPLPPVRRTLDAWGTTITLDAVGSDGDAGLLAARLEAALPEVRGLVDEVDRVFSTWREDSLVSALRRGDLAEGRLAQGSAPERLLADVLDRCRRAREISGGSFDPWAAPGGLDPSGLVKGWGAGRIADLLVARGLPRVCVNAAGDIAARGVGPDGGAWRVGVVHPDHRDRLCAELPTGWVGDLAGPDGSVATSGFSEQVGHVVDPTTGATTTRARQATVVGPDAGLADALATALLVDGHAGDVWFEDFAATDLGWGRVRTRWGALVVEGDTLWRMGACSLLD